MPTNQQRRDAAKRKLERQLVRRQERVRTRRRQTIIGGAIVGVLVVAGVVFLVTRPAAVDTAGADTTTGVTGDCTYTATDQKPVKSVTPPSNTSPAVTGTVSATITLSQGAMPVTLDRELAPCAVNAFISLAAQKFYDDTTCHRLTADSDLKILQCGDPSGTGRGGPGYSYANETNPQVPADAGTDTTSTAAAAAAQYPIGTLAMASPTSGGENGSQFFIVYGDSALGSGGYTKIGTVGAEGMAVVQQIGAAGTVAGPNGAEDAPAQAVNIVSVTVPDDAVTAAKPVETSTDLPSSELPTDSGVIDSGATDSGATDTGVTDSGATDSGTTGTGSTESRPADTAASTSAAG